jgi:CspA family cold shock protein
MKKKHLVLALYVVVMVVYLFQAFDLFSATFHSTTIDAGLESIKQQLALAYVSFALLLVWCMMNLKRRKWIHLAVLVFALGNATLTLLSGSSDSMALALQLVPAVLLIILALPPLPSRVKGPREVGRVKWFNATKGFGFVTREHGDDVFVHYRSIRGDGHRTLREGQKVEFVVTQGDKGLQAEDVLPL